MLHPGIDLHKRTIAIPLSWGSRDAAARPHARAEDGYLGDGRAGRSLDRRCRASIFMV